MTAKKRALWRHPKWTKAHRWITVVIGLQVTLWIASGLVFVFNDIDNVHGDFEFKKPEPVALETSSLEPGALRAVRSLEKSLERPISPTTIAMMRRLGRIVYAVYENGSRTASGYVDVETGNPAKLISAEQASSVAASHYKGTANVISVERLEEAPMEYRGKPLPVYRVNFDDWKETSFYVSPETARVVTRRNWNWRLFDWFWMLHTMDYWERDDFNHWLIRGAAVLAAFAAGTGIVLLGQRFLRRKD